MEGLRKKKARFTLIRAANLALEEGEADCNYQENIE